MDKIYLYIFSIFTEKKPSQEPVQEDKEENQKSKLSNELYFALRNTVTNRTHIYHITRSDTPYNVG